MGKSKSTAIKPTDLNGSFNEVFDSPETSTHGGRHLVVNYPAYGTRDAAGSVQHPMIHESIDAAPFDNPNVLSAGDALELAAAYTRAAHELLFGA
jgi:hypothetical protein